MRIIKSVENKVCSDGAIWKELTLDTKVTSGFVDILLTLGTNEITLGVGSGFFKIYIKDCLLIRGFLDDTSVEVRFWPDVTNTTEPFMHDLMSWYQDGDPNYAMIERCVKEMKTKIKEDQ